MKYRYDGEAVTYHPQLGMLVPGEIGEGPDELVRMCIAGGLLVAVETTPEPAASPAEED